MRLKKFLLFGLIAAVLPAFAEEAADRKTATSLKYVEHELDTRQNKFTAEQNKAMEYTNTAGAVEKRAVKSDLGTSTTDTSLPMVGGVNTKLNQKQDDIDPFNDHTAVTYTGQPGGIGRKGIYQTTGTYAEQRNDLIDAKTFNAALKKGLDREFVCSDNRQPGTDECWLWEIHSNAGHRLPDGYTELEYIESTGTQYIDTGISGPTRWIGKGQSVQNTTKSQALLGGNSGGASGTFVGSVRGDNIWTTCDIPYSTTYPITTAQDFDLSFVNGGVSGRIGGTIIEPVTATGGLDMTWTIGWRNNYYPYIGKMFYFKAYQNDALVRNFVPARHNSDNKVGMYDRVHGVFYTNAATSGDNFTAGPEINSTVYIPQNQ